MLSQERLGFCIIDCVQLQREGSGKFLPRSFQLIFKFQICQIRRKAGFLYRLDLASPSLE